MCNPQLSDMLITVKASSDQAAKEEHGMQIGEVIRKYRKERNLTQEEMARYLGVTAPAVNKWENGVSQTKRY